MRESEDKEVVKRVLTVSEFAGSLFQTPFMYLRLDVQAPYVLVRKSERQITAINFEKDFI